MFCDLTGCPFSKEAALAVAEFVEVVYCRIPFFNEKLCFRWCPPKVVNLLKTTPVPSKNR